jgi:colanic acid biosynthesis glycosyl transferase WcaI
VKVLIISDQYLPSTRSGSILIHDLINELLIRKHKITLITSTQDNNNRNKNKKLDIIRIKTFSYNKKNYILKGFNQIYLFLQIILKILFINKNVDKTFIYCPPLFFGLINIFFKKQKKIINIQDFFPQNAIDLGIIKNNILIFILKKIERFIYNTNDYILVNSNNAKNYLIKRIPGIKKKVIFNYNWTKINRIKGKKYKKNKIFKFIFGGSVGPAQDLKKVFGAFKNLNKKCELHIYGDGILLKDLKKEILIKDIKNIKILKPISNNLFSQKLQMYDSALLTLNSKNKTPFIPGKFNFYCSNKKNVTAIVHKQCDLNHIIKKNNLGFVTSTQNNKQLTIFLKKIINSKQIDKMNINAFKFARINLNVKSFANKLEQI